MAVTVTPMVLLEPTVAVAVQWAVMVVAVQVVVWFILITTPYQDPIL